MVSAAELSAFDAVLTDSEFARVRALVYGQSRIRLGVNKRGLVKARLAKRLRATGHSSYGAYLDYVDQHPAGAQELVCLLDAISTNKTSFFREDAHFTYLAAEVLPALVERKERQKQRRLRLWSAACSTGEEPYTLAIVLRETCGALPGWDVRILATDLNTRVLEHARHGVYDDETLADVPHALRLKYFTRERRAGEAGYQVVPALRDLVVFRRLNLIEPAYPFSRGFDVVFCRNVMIYFDRETQLQLVRKFHGVLEPNGYLFIGHSESIRGLDAEYRRLEPTIYQRTP